MSSTSAASASSQPLPLAGVRVIEFSHMVMGPTCGMVLADLGADVIKIEPAPAGDNTRRLTGTGIGFFPTFNRNKRSLCIDMKKPAGRELVLKLIAQADVVLENFRPGAMDKLGLGHQDLSKLNPRLIYCSCKGFLPGPYEHRSALDEVVQMMGGLAYMTGPPGQPLRAGSSVNDIMGGLFAVIGVLSALRQRDVTGRGSLVQSGLFETNMVLVAQHMARVALEGKEPPPYGDPKMEKPWPLYDVFRTADPDAQVFVGVVTDTQWRSFCAAFGLDDLLHDPSLDSMQKLAAARPRILARVSEIFAKLSKAELMARCEKLGLPFAPIARPGDLFDDPHLKESGGLLPIDVARNRVTNGRLVAELPGLPLSFGTRRLSLKRQPPQIGEHNREIASEAGMDTGQLSGLIADGILFAGSAS